MRHPSLLPVEQIEPALVGMVPICRELRMRSEGLLDNLFITENGDLALVECKLWRNPEARREVVAQILGYAKDMATWSFEELEEAINGTKPLDGQSSSRRRLWDLVGGNPNLNEASFHDAVSRNLARGRFLLLVVGDGIQERMAAMSDFLQQHAGFHFTLAFVELALFEAPGGFLVQPRVLARTENIERAIVRVEDGRISVTAPNVPAGGPAATRRTTSITEERFYEELQKTCPSAPEQLRSFFDELSQYDVRSELGSDSLVLRWPPDEENSWNMATISKKRAIWTDYLGKQAQAAGLLPAHKQYLEDLKSLVPGASVRVTPKETAWYVAVNKDYVKVDALLADDARRKGWLAAIQRFQAAASPHGQDR